MIINVPDFTWACDYFLKKQKDKDYWDLRDTNHCWNVNNILGIFFGGQAFSGDFHYIGFTVNSTFKMLTAAGFEDIQIKTMWDAHDMEVIFAEAYKRKI